MNSMKNLFLVAAAVAMTLFCACSETVNYGPKIEKSVEVENFSSLDMKGVANIEFKSSDTCSVYISGDSLLVVGTDIKVEDGVLKIAQQKNLKVNGQKPELTIIINAPTLQKLNLEGVGSFTCIDTLRTDGFMEIDLGGVGEYNLSAACQKLDCDIDGVGSFTLNVDVDTLNLEGDGVGEITVNGRAGVLNKKCHGIGAMNDNTKR